MYWHIGLIKPDIIYRMYSRESFLAPLSYIAFCGHLPFNTIPLSEGVIFELPLPLDTHSLHTVAKWPDPQDAIKAMLVMKLLLKYGISALKWLPLTPGNNI
jgi:hypothetical protein